MYSIPRLAVSACATLFLLACESVIVPPLPPSPPPPPPPPLSVEISGPLRIHAEGTYSWEAFAFGGSGEYQYQWDITRRGDTVTTTHPKLSLRILESDGNVSLKLTVTSGAQVISQNRDVSNCINRCRY